MVNEQPEALRLADDLTKHLGGNTATQAAAELRRLHEDNTELLEALRVAKSGEKLCAKVLKARAAIAKAERTMT